MMVMLFMPVPLWWLGLFVFMVMVVEVIVAFHAPIAVQASARV